MERLPFFLARSGVAVCTDLSAAVPRSAGRFGTGDVVRALVPVKVAGARPPVTLPPAVGFGGSSRAARPGAAVRVLWLLKGAR